METQDAYNVSEFCQRHNISRSKYYEIVKAGEGPRIFKIGNSSRISKEAAADWRRDMEAREAA